MAEEKKKVDGPAATQVELTTVARVYLKNPDINRSSAWHRAYVGGLDGTPMRCLEIVGGTKRNVPLAEYEAFARAGVVTTERPRRQSTEDDD